MQGLSALPHTHDQHSFYAKRGERIEAWGKEHYLMSQAL
ncbi:hypothetical protein [Pseudomonas syringae]|nr:hypothetical protein [Pseudomonas syringae]